MPPKQGRVTFGAAGRGAGAEAGGGAEAGTGAEAGAGAGAGGASAGARGGSLEALALPSPKGASPDNCARSRPAEGKIPPLTVAGSCAPGAKGTGAEAAARGAERGMPSAIVVEHSSRSREVGNVSLRSSGGLRGGLCVVLARLEGRAALVHVDVMEGLRMEEGGWEGVPTFLCKGEEERIERGKSVRAFLA